MDPRTTGFVAIGAAVAAVIALILAISASSTASGTEAKLERQMRARLKARIEKMRTELDTRIEKRLGSLDGEISAQGFEIKQLRGKFQSNAGFKAEVDTSIQEAKREAFEHTSRKDNGLRREIKAGDEDTRRYTDRLVSRNRKALDERLEKLENKVDRELRLTR